MEHRKDFFGKAIQTLCENDDLDLEEALAPTCLFARVWHNMRWPGNAQNQGLYLEQPETSFHESDLDQSEPIEEQKSSDEDKSERDDSTHSSDSEEQLETTQEQQYRELRSSIRNAPILLIVLTPRASPLLLRPVLPEA